jgi:ABC-type antimicrobial peptide transport system permease subunit
MVWTNGYFWMASAVFILITSLVSGSYPAFYLSSFNPVQVLKGSLRVGRFATLPRKVLVVLQFTVSIVLIIGTIIVYRQIKHAKNRPVGYNREGLLYVPIKSRDLLQKYDVLERQLKNEGVVSEMARSSSPTTAVWSNNDGLEWENKDPNKVASFGTIWITPDYGKTVGWKFMEGRYYSTEFATDSVSSASDKNIVHSIIINEAAVKYMELKNPVGQIIRWGDYPFRIIGVIKDMVMESPFDPVKQTMYLVYYDEASAGILMRINSKMSVGGAITKIGSAFKKLVPTVPFDYKFVDSEYATKFAAEERIGSLASFFASLAIFISCLGLFGLASFVAEKRTKEIGIRKVLGASIYNLWQMLSKEFVVLVLVACCIAVPLAYYFLHQWLQKYEYRTEISWWVFVVAIGGAVMITLLTVSFQAIKAAIANPVKSLRTE